MTTERYCSLSNTLDDWNDPSILQGRCPLFFSFFFPTSVFILYAAIICNSESVQSRGEGQDKRVWGVLPGGGRAGCPCRPPLRLVSCLNGGICDVRVELPNIAGILTRFRASDSRLDLERSPPVVKGYLLGSDLGSGYTGQSQ